jgi:hypothetical protein
MSRGSCLSRLSEPESHPCRIEPINRWKKACGMLFHSSTSTSRSSCSVCPFCNSDTFITSLNVTMHDVTWLVFVKTFWTRITSVFFLGRHYHRICHQLNIYGMNSVDVFATVKIPRKHYRNCVTKAISTKFLNIIIKTNHGQTEIVMQYGGLWSSVTCVTTSCSNDSFAYPTHRTNQSLDKVLWDVKPPYCMTISVRPWFVLIIMPRNFVDIALIAIPISI